MRVQNAVQYKAPANTGSNHVRWYMGNSILDSSEPMQPRQPLPAPVAVDVSPRHFSTRPLPDQKNTISQDPLFDDALELDGKNN